MPQGSRHFPLLVSIVQSLSLEPGFPPLLQSVISSSLSLSLLSSLFLPFSLSLSRVFGISLISLPDSLHHSAGSSVFVEVYVSISLTPRSPTVRLPRSYGSFVSLVISSYGRLCVSLRLSCRVLFVWAYISPVQILWKVSVLFVLAL